jgi:hypothetical protein
MYSNALAVVPGAPYNTLCIPTVRCITEIIPYGLNWLLSAVAHTYAARRSLFIFIFKFIPHTFFYIGYRLDIYIYIYIQCRTIVRWICAYVHVFRARDLNARSIGLIHVFFFHYFLIQWIDITFSKAYNNNIRYILIIWTVVVVFFITSLRVALRGLLNNYNLNSWGRRVVSAL